MKKWIAFLPLVLIAHTVLIASKYEQQMKDLAVETAQLIEKRGIEKVAIWNFSSMDGESDVLSRHLSEDFSVHFLNASNTLQVYDRNNLESVLEELRLHQSGLIDPETTKELGAFIGVEAIITGQYSVFGNRIKVWVKAIETASAFQIAALNKEINRNKRISMRTIHDSKKHIAQVSSQQKEPTRIKKSGTLRLVNQKSVSVYVNIKRGNFSKRVLVGGDSSSEVLALEPGIYDCEAGIEHSKTPLETFQVKIKPYKRSKKKFKGYKFSAFSLMF